MKKTVTEFYCDLCGKKVGKDELHEGIRLPAVSSVSDTDGACVKEHFVFDVSADLCDECLDRVCVVERGFREVHWRKR